MCSIKQSKDTETLSIDEFQSSLVVHEHEFQKNCGEEQALKVVADEKLIMEVEVDIEEEEER